MSVDVPSIAASDIITDVEARLRAPGISSTIYLPWISYAYQKTFNALSKVGQHVREAYFGDSDTISLPQSQLEHVISDSIPRFGGLVAIEIKYGATGDTRNAATKLPSKANWVGFDHVSTSDRPKNSPLYYVLGGKIGVIPVPPEAGAIAYIDFIKKPYQIEDVTDVIDLPYQFLYPVVNYVQAKAIERYNEDYSQGQALENKFTAELEEIQITAASEFDENDGTGFIQEVDSSMRDNPFNH